jgi:hypothetical protein
LEDRIGGRVVIDIRRFTRDDEWARVILGAAQRSHTTLPEDARASLEHADGTGRGWVA